MQAEIVLEMHGICKAFPGVRALHNVDFALRKGEIHALMGENGAGKSTLIKVITGVYEKDAGQIAGLVGYTAKEDACHGENRYDPAMAIFQRQDLAQVHSTPEGNTCGSFLENDAGESGEKQGPEQVESVIPTRG